MCGIVGYVGRSEAYPILIKGLKRLEYRGYDSAGIALVTDNGLVNVYKNKGKVINLEEGIKDKDITGRTGIAHTRWATHGEPSVVNAHPHYSTSEHLALVHNGIIENYRDLKTNLETHGYTFRSNTDTEVLVQLIEYIKVSSEVDLLDAVVLALEHVAGAYAIAVVELGRPGRIIAARKSSPLVIGIGDGELEGEFFLASDATPIVEYTQKVVYLDDGEVADICFDRPLHIVDLSKTVVRKEAQTIALNITQIEKGGYPHFMLKEIYDQPHCLADCMLGRLVADHSKVVLSSLIDHHTRLINAQRIIIVACGTSWHAGLIAKIMIESLARIPVEVEYASEFRYRDPLVGPEDLVIAISQSGETADTLAAIQLAKDSGAFIYGICNAIGSSIAREAHTGTYIHVGPEIGVASTKAFTGQVTVLTMLTLALARERGTINEEKYTTLTEALAEIPQRIEEVLQEDRAIAAMAHTFTYADNFIYLGRGYNFPVALEGALKLKEISYIHAEGYPAAEMKHGPIALIDERMPVVVIATHNNMYEKILSNVQEIKARQGVVLAIVSRGDTEIARLADYVIELPMVEAELEPLITVVPLQLIAYHIAVCKGKDVDRPRNLAKSVTVE